MVSKTIKKLGVVVGLSAIGLAGLAGCSYDEDKDIVVEEILDSNGKKALVVVKQIKSGLNDSYRINVYSPGGGLRASIYKRNIGSNDLFFHEDSNGVYTVTGNDPRFDVKFESQLDSNYAVKK